MLLHLRHTAEKAMDRPKKDDRQDDLRGIIVPQPEMTEHSEALVGHAIKIANTPGKRVRPSQTYSPGV